MISYWYWLIIVINQNHIQSEGQIVLQECNVRFYGLVQPESFTTPYTIVASFGIDSHLPPPITKTLQYLMKQIQQVISKKDTLNLTTSMKYSLLG